MNPSAMIAVKLMNGMHVAMNNMLTEFEVGKKDVLNPELVNEMETLRNIAAQVQQLVQQNQQLQNANAQLQAIIGQGQGLPAQAGPQPAVQGSMPVGSQQQGPGNGPPAVQQ